MTQARQTVDPRQATQPFYAGVDVGGTSIKIGLVDDVGRTLGFDQIDTDEERGPADAVDRIARSLKTLTESTGIDRSEVVWAGLGTPGTMDIPAGMILEPPNIPHWRRYPIRDALREACGWPVAFANDGGAAAAGEFWVGSGQQFNSIVMLTLGTGVGGGIILDGRSIDGENSHGSECGHIIIDSSPQARRCSCGRLGHLEGYASATAVVKRTEEALAAGADSSLKQLLADGVQLNGLIIAKAAAAGDELAHKIVLQTGWYLGIGIVSLMHTIDPGAVILGGAMNFGRTETQLGREFLAAIVEVVAERAFPIVAERAKILFARLGGDAGYIGAAALAREAHRRSA